MNEVEIVITAQNRTFQEFERVRKHVRGIVDDVEKASKSLPEKLGKDTGEKAGKALKEGFSFAIKSFGDLPTEAKLVGGAVGAAFGVAAAGQIAATLSAGVLVGATAAGIIGGFKLAAQDPAVKDTATALGEEILAQLSAISTTSGFNQVAIDSLNALGEAWDRNSTNVERALRASAQHVKPLLDGLIQFADDVVPAITRGIERAAPVIRVLGREVGETGEVLGDALDDMTENSEEAAAALHQIFYTVQALIAGFGELTRRGSEFYGDSIDFVADFTGAFEDIARYSPFPGLADQVRAANNQAEELQRILRGEDGIQGAVLPIRGVASSFGEMADETRAVNRALDEMNEKFKTTFGLMMSVEEANIAVKLGFLELKEAIRDNGRTLDENSEAGLRNKQIINDQIGALERARDAAIENGQGSKEATDKANAAYVAGIETIRRMLKELGLLTPAMQRYLDQWIELARPKVIPVSIRLVGTKGGGSIGGQYAQAHGGLTPTEVPGAASGMMLGGGSLTKVGEFGEEYARLPPGTQMYNHGTTKRIDAALAGAGNTMRIVVEPASGFGSTWVDETIRQLRFRVRNESGGDVETFFNAYAGS